MTTIPPEGVQPERPEHALVHPKPDSRLEQLLCLYKRFKTERDESAAKFDQLCSDIQDELRVFFPKDESPTKSFKIPATAMWPEITFAYKTGEYLPTKVLREHLPDIYNTFKQAKTPWWELREKQTGRRPGR